MSNEERKAWFQSLDRLGRLIANLRALADAPGYTADIASQAADEIELLASISEWRPIETAPKDGTKFMAWDSRTRTPWFVYWDGKKLHPNRPTLTHWQPHPAGPEQNRSTT